MARACASRSARPPPAPHRVRGRSLADGTLEVHGRFDDQVKIRGIRVEPDEVAAVLGRCPGVARCAVLAAQSPETHLVAYVVADAAAGVTPAGLRAFLRTRV